MSAKQFGNIILYNVNLNRSTRKFDGELIMTHQGTNITLYANDCDSPEQAVAELYEHIEEIESLLKKRSS